VPFGAYEIHLGVTLIEASSGHQPFAFLDDGAPEGFVDGTVIGTYLHGAFEQPDVCAEVLGVTPPGAAKTEHYERLALWFGQHARHLEQWGLD
jgi:adenosylcobyric acid synthase